MKRPKLTVDELSHLLGYDEETGNLIWKVIRGSRARPGTIAGTDIGDGRKQMSLDGIRVYTSHVVWFLHNGEWPTMLVDHKDGNRGNDRIGNLRLATSSQNLQNKVAWKTKELPKGVYAYKDRYKAILGIHGKNIYLGVFDTPEEAEAAYRGASIALHGEFSIYARKPLSD